MHHEKHHATIDWIVVCYEYVLDFNYHCSTFWLELTLPLACPVVWDNDSLQSHSCRFHMNRIPPYRSERRTRDATNLQFHYPPRPAATPCPTTTTRKLILAEPNPQKTRNFENLLLQEKNTAGSMLELYKPYLLHCCAEKDSQTNSKDLKLLC